MTTRTVQVNVIAQDGDGRPVTGLTQDEFRLFDQGQEQKIVFFSQEENTVPANSMTAAAALPPNTFSNRFAEKSGVPTSVTVILLDGLNTHFHDMAYARKQVGKFLSQIQPQDHVALYSLSSNLTILHDFTQDASALLLALERDQNTENIRTYASEPEPADTGIAAFDSAINTSNARVAQFYMNDRVERTALAIKTIADHLAGLPGRKNLLWVSASFPIDIIGGEMPMDHLSYTQQIEDTARALNDANVAIYPVDARGLIANPMNLGPGPRGGRSTAASPFPARQNIDTMNTMAERTGGRAFYNTNDIQGAIRKAVDDSRVTYVLGYYPSNTNWDGKFRELKVEVKKSGVHLRFRRGYYAVADTTATPQEKAELMADAAWSPLEDTQLGLHVKVEPSGPDGARELKAVVSITPRELRFEQNGDHWTDSLEVQWIEIGNTGRSLGTISKTLPMNFDQATYDEATRKDIVFADNLKLRDDAVELRLVARDAGSGNIGSVNVPLIRLFAKPGAQTAPK